MTRFTASRFGALLAALTITLSACSEDYPVVPQFSGVNPTPAATGIITFAGDPAIVDILLSGCGEVELPSSYTHVATWRDDLGSFAIELYEGCYDVRVVRETYTGWVTQEQLGVVISGGDVHVFAPDSDA